MNRRELTPIHFGFLERMKSGEELILTVLHEKQVATLGETSIHPQYVADMVFAGAIKCWKVEGRGRKGVAYHYDLL